MTEVKIVALRVGESDRGSDATATSRPSDGTRSYGSDIARQAANRDRVPSSNYAQSTSAQRVDSPQSGE